MTKREVACDNCGDTVRRWPGNIGDHVFCSRECYRDFSRNRTGESHPDYERITVECEYCGTEIDRIPARVERDKNAFCDTDCKASYQQENPETTPSKDRVKTTCHTCGETLHLTNYRYKRSPRHFCSRECKGEWWSKEFRGENHHNWQGGFDWYYGPNWSEQNAKVRRRDNHQCFFCGLSSAASKVIRGRRLDVHHVTRKEEYESYRNANRLGNLLTLCAVCHSSLDAPPP